MTYHLLQEEHVRMDADPLNCWTMYVFSIDKNNAPLSFARVFILEDTLFVEDWHQRLL